MSDFDNAPGQIIHMKKIQSEGLDLFIKKNADYGNSYKHFGLIGLLVRLQDKMNRAIHITQNSIQVKDETLRDTLIDLHNYSAMAIMEMEPCQQMMFRIRTNGSEPPLQSDVVECDTLIASQPSVSDPPRNDAFDDCNHRNINLR